MATDSLLFDDFIFDSLSCNSIPSNSLLSDSLLSNSLLSDNLFNTKYYPILLVLAWVINLSKQMLSYYTHFWDQFLFIDSMTSLSVLETWIDKAIQLLPYPHLSSFHNSEAFLLLESAKTQLQNYLFTRRFAWVVESNDKQCKIVCFDCLRHHRKQQNTSKIQEKDN